MRTLHLVALSLTLALSLLACRSSSPGSLSADDAAALVENRNWMDLWPTDDRQTLHVYRFTPSMGGGVYQDRTLFAGDFELFNYEIDGDVIRIRWPHTGEHEAIKYRIETVKGPEPFDLRMSFESNLRGPAVFYGRKSETPETPKGFPVIRSLAGQ